MTRRLLQVLVLALVAAGTLVVVPSRAQADTRPPDPATPETVTADPLPTVQHNGVAWDSVTVGRKVFVVGSFSSARPAGSALGVNEVPRSNILAFDITTGVLDPSFAPVLDGQALTVAVSPDQTTIYVGGSFQKVNGQWRVGIAAFDVASGALRPWAPVLGSTVRAIGVSDSTVYVGGDFTGAASRTGQALTPRTYAAAFDRSTGALLGWNPAPDASVTALTLNHGKSKVILAGRFQNVSGQAWYGMAAIDPVSGAALPWSATSVVRNAGSKASLTSLVATRDGVYGTGYVYGAGGNFEGAFRADNDTGAIIWLADCHGDHYDTFLQEGVVYTTGHAHYCGNIGGFPQTTPWTMYHSGALTNDARGTITKEIYGYANFEGQPAPHELNWFPTWLTGTATTSKQAAWSIAGNDDYLVYAGEFIGLNGAPQQGLVRFAKRDIAPELVRPAVTDGLTPSLISSTPGEVRVGWQATHDRDNEAITYRVYRNYRSLSDTPVHQVTVNSRFWKRPDISFVDRTVLPGTTHEYRVFAFDPKGNRVSGSPATITVAAPGQSDAYVNTILADAPNHYFPLDDAPGSTLMRDLAGSDHVLASSAVTMGGAGMRAGSAGFSGTASANASTVSQLGPNTFSLEAWFRTRSTAGGAIVGYGTNRTGNSSWQDRMIYLDGAGRASFGVYQDAVKAVSSGPGLNDGKWHHVVGTVGPLGLRLYVDGQLVASRGDATAARYYSGVWRIGGDAVPTGWPNRPTNGYFSGSVDEIAIYGNVLSPAQVASHFVAGGGVSPQPASPSDAYGAAAFALDPDVYWRLDDSAGTTAADASRALNPGVATGGVTWGAGGALYQYSGPSASFDGVDDVIVASKPVLGGPASFSAGVWFRTTTTTGGKLIGFGNSSSGLSTSYDRHIYMQNDGTLVFGTYTGVQNRVTSATAYNDGKWHHAIGTQGLNGMALYVDGVLVGTHPATKGQVYDGYWRIGGDTTWGSTSRYFRGQLDEALVFDRALSSQEVAGLHAKGVAPAANQLPVASFTAQSVGLAVEVDASASTDADGTIASYAWDFGDGSRGSGPTDTHVYPRPGTYTIVLTVTDDRGAEASEARTVTVEALPNQAPQAAFTVSVSLLTVSLDGSGSSDPDGSIATYAWDFGDGTTGSGKQPADHVYATAGSYKVTLTVTDDDGATASTSKTVTVTATYASDAFGRTVASGWGTADLGGAWTTGSASLFAVSSGQGRITVAASKGPQIYLASSTATDADVRADFTVDRAATGGGTYLSLVARGATNEGYRGKGRIMPDGSVQLSVVRALAGVETTLGTASLPAGTFAAGDTLKFRMVAAGLAPTSLRLKVWKSTVTQPANWQITATDSTAGLQKAGGVGVIGFLSGTATNGPAIVGVDNVAAVLFGTAD